MELKNRPKTAGHIAVGIFSILLFANSVQLPGFATRLLGAVPLVIVVLFQIFDRWAWKWPQVRQLVKRPLIEGTWTGNLTSYRRDPETDDRINSTHEIAIVIDQTFTDIKVTLMTKESKSYSIVSELVRRGEDDYVLFYQYDNTPKMEHRLRSVIHRGGASIEIAGEAPTSLQAEYWTNRETQGTFDVNFVKRDKVRVFADLRELEAV